MKRDIAIGHIGPTLVVFFAFFSLTIWAAIDARIDVEDKRNELLNRHVENTKSRVSDRINTYEDILRASKGLFGSSDKVTREEWKQFVETFELKDRYSGIQAVGYAELIDKNNLGERVSAIRQKDMADFQITPSGERDAYVPILYLDSTNPDDSKSQKSIGYDIASNQQRRQAMEKARDTAETTITDILGAVQYNQESNSPAIIMYLPVYKSTKPPDSIEKRRADLLGYVFIGTYSHDLLKDGSLDHTNFSYQVVDNNTNASDTLYETPNYSSLAQNEKAIEIKAPFTVKNQNWEILASISPEAISAKERARPSTVLWGGILLSVFVAGFIYLLLLNRTRVSLDEEQKEIQEAKDELLALASHQLRTPATGVKQYIGLLRDGYAGKLSREQSDYIEKAYVNNERQLQTINKMLFVARANAKKIELRKERFDVNSLLKSVADDFSSQIKENQQKLILSLPKTKTYIEADNKYLRMCVENLMSNAAKYTPEKGKISLKLRKPKGTLIITVEDTGVGIDESDYPLLFRKFSRIPNELTNKVSGSGIGLYLARKVIQAHGGSLEFESAVNEGSTFIIKLPR